MTVFRRLDTSAPDPLRDPGPTGAGPSGRRGRGTPGRSLVTATGVGLAALGAAGVGLVAKFLLYTAHGQDWDGRVMRGVDAGQRTQELLGSGLEVVSVGAVAASLAGAAVVGLARRRLDLAVAAGVVIVGANVTTQILKYHVFHRPDFGMATTNTLPSGHVTVITSILMAALLLAPARWRGVVVPLAAFAATCAGVAVVVLDWHRPSDVMAAYGVVLTWVGLAVAGLGLAGRGAPGARILLRRVLGRTGPATLGVSLVGGLLLATGSTVDGGRREWALTAAVMGALALSSAAVVGLGSAAFDLVAERPADELRDEARRAARRARP